MQGAIPLIVKWGTLLIRTGCSVLEDLAADLLFGTIYICWSLKGISPMRQKHCADLLCTGTNNRQ